MKIIYTACGSAIKVDAEDYPLLSRHAWVKNSEGYARTALNDTYLYMHRLVMNPGRGMYIDHVNHDRLDNRKENLRPATNSTNQLNRKGGRGKCYRWHSIAKKWNVRFTRKGQEIYLGLYAQEAEAIAARDAWLRANP